MQLFRVASLAAVVLGLAAQPALAFDITAAVGRSEKSTSTLRIGLQKEFQSRWWQSDTGSLTGYWDAGYTYWQGDKEADNHSLSVSPVLRYEFNSENLKPYIEAGVGIAFFKHTRIENRKLSTSLQFEDRLGVGLRFGRQTLGLRATHYSNAGLKRPNDGINMYSVHYSLAL